MTSGPPRRGAACLALAALVAAVLGACDAGGTEPRDAELRRELLAPLDGSAGTCPEGWAPVRAGTPEAPSLAAEGSDWIPLAVACPGGDRVVVLTHDM